MICGLFTPLLAVPYDLLEPAEGQELRQHLDGCARCVADREALTAAIARACPPPAAPPREVWRAVTAGLEAEAAPAFELDVNALLAEQLKLDPIDVPAFRAHDPLIGTRVGTCVVLECVGRGSMGAVYRGYDPVRRCEIALRAIDSNPDWSERTYARHERRGAKLAKIQHPNVLRIFPPVRVEQGLWTLQEFVRGSDLQERIRKRGRCTPSEAVVIALSAARGLRAAHDEGVVHMNIKPSNVLISEDGAIKVVDFQGTSLGAEASLTRCGVALGNPAYQSPDVCRGKFEELDGRTDIYSLGVVFYELLTNRLTCSAQTPIELFGKIIAGQIDPPIVELPTAHQQVLAKMLALNPDDRYADADALINDLEALQHGLPVAADEPLPWLPRPVFSNTARTRFWIALLGLGLLFVILIAWRIAT